VGGDSGAGSQDSAPDGTNADAMPSRQDASTDSMSTDAQAPVADSGADVGGAESGAGGRDGAADASGTTSGAGCGCALAETRTPPTAGVLGLLAALLLRRRRVALRPTDLSQGKEEAS
jgi:MYXO-CTERM domain-containing protein